MLSEEVHKVRKMQPTLGDHSVSLPAFVTRKVGRIPKRNEILLCQHEALPEPPQHSYLPQGVELVRAMDHVGRSLRPVDLVEIYEGDVGCVFQPPAGIVADVTRDHDAQ